MLLVTWRCCSPSWPLLNEKRFREKNLHVKEGGASEHTHRLHNRHGPMVAQRCLRAKMNSPRRFALVSCIELPKRTQNELRFSLSLFKMMSYQLVLRFRLKYIRALSFSWNGDCLQSEYCTAQYTVLYCTFYLIAHLTPFLFYYLFLFSFSPIFIYIFSCVMFHCFIAFYVIFYFVYFIFLHFPLSGPVLTYISLLIIPCMIVYVTNNKEPWTLRTLNVGRMCSD